MASEVGRAGGWRAFPVGLTIAAALGFSILVGLGVWQLHRLAWKQDLLARIDRLKNAPPLSIAQAMAPSAERGDAEFTRVAVRCAAPPAPSPVAYRYALRDGAVGWRLLTACHLPEAPPDGYDGVILDRGLVERFAGAMAPARAAFPEPAVVTGVLRAVGARPLLGGEGSDTLAGLVVFRVIDRDALMRLAARSGIRHPLPYLLAVEAETPAPAGITPAALPQDIPNNHFVYALTWFALAGILAWFYIALVWRRLAGR